MTDSDDWYTYMGQGLTNDAPNKRDEDTVSSPSHYARWPLQPIEFIRANRLPFLVGNIIKYVMRYDAKNGLEDLKKARQYLDWLIEDAT